MVRDMSEGQDQITLLTNLVQSLLQLAGTTGPAVMPGVIYTRPQLERNLAISPATMTVWIDAGLKRYRPATKKDLFNGSKVIEFIENNADLAYPKDAKEKAERRKKNRIK